MYPSIPCWIHRISTPSHRRSFTTRCFPPYQITLRNGALRSRSCFRTRSRSCHQWLRCSCKWMEMGFLDHVVVIRIQSSSIGVYHARGESKLGKRYEIRLIIDLIREHPLQASSPTEEIDWKRQDQIPRRNRFIPHVFKRYRPNDPPSTTHHDIHRTNCTSYRSIHRSHLRYLVLVLRVFPDCLPRGLHVPYCQLESSFLGIVGW